MKIHFVSLHILLHSVAHNIEYVMAHQMSQGDIDELDSQIVRILSMECLSEKECIALCEKAKTDLETETNVQAVRAPVTVCVDIHDQF